MRTSLYPFHRIGLIQVKKTLLRMPLSSSGDFCLETRVELERLPKFSSSKIAECMQHRRNTGREISACWAAVTGIVKRTTSHDTDASKYSVISSEDLDC